MNKKTIKYIGFYDLPNSKSCRVSNLAATNKMNYIASAIMRAGYNVEIISPSWMGDSSNIKYEKQNTTIVENGISVTFCPSWKTRNKITRNIKIVFSLVWLFFYLLINVKRSEKILAYHVQWISIPIRAAKFLKRFELILEVEEIYGEVWVKSKKLYKMEKKLINSAESYIFVSDVLKKLLNKDEIKKDVILYGSYFSLPVNIELENEDELIKLIYAGSIDLTKGGAYKALEVMEYLPQNYQLHILGHGSSNQIVKLQKLINELNQKKCNNICIYAGTLHGKEYSDYLMKCDIALNPQNLGDYMATAFPSKIISYLSHNLHVVSTKLKSIACSSIADYIYFTEDDNPKSIAEAIVKIDLHNLLNGNEIVRKLDKQFIIDIKKLLED